MKRLRTGGGALLLAWGVLAWGAPAWAEGEEAPGPVEVEMTEFRFTPDTITLRAGVEARLVLVNRGAVMHEFASPYLAEVGVAVETDGIRVETVGLGEVEVEPGHAATLIFTPEAAGRFVFLCGAKAPVDHAGEGMRGTLIVQ